MSKNELLNISNSLTLYNVKEILKNRDFATGYQPFICLKSGDIMRWCQEIKDDIL